MQRSSLFVFSLLGLVVAACSGTSNEGLFGPTPTDDGGVSPGDGGTTPSDGGDASADGAKPCTGLECQKPACEDGETTRLRGKVYDPAGANVLHGVMVYVPSGPLPPLGKGASCDPCGAITPKPIAMARTDATGSFSLDDVPVGKDVPVVVQIGKWRRTIKVDIDRKCRDNDAPDRVLRLPKNGTEGDMPHVAVTAGGCDALECLLRGIGIDDSEFVAGASPSGHVHVFAGDGGKGVNGSPPASALWDDIATMKPYDAVLLSCECDEGAEKKSAAARQAMHDYTTQGGRVLATHYHYTWLKSAPHADWNGIAQWSSTFGGGAAVHDVDTSTAAGQAFAQWLVAVNASPTPGKIQLTDVTDSLSKVNAPAQPIISTSTAPIVPRVFSFATPIGGPACGSFTFTDVHTNGIATGGQTFPLACTGAGLSAQQKALEYLFFEEDACK